MLAMEAKEKPFQATICLLFATMLLYMGWCVLVGIYGIGKPSPYCGCPSSCTLCWHNGEPAANACGCACSRRARKAKAQHAVASHAAAAISAPGSTRKDGLHSHVGCLKDTRPERLHQDIWQ